MTITGSIDIISPLQKTIVYDGPVAQLVCPVLQQNKMTSYDGPVAQLVRAPALQAGGQGFESLQVHHSEFVKEVAEGLRPSATSLTNTTKKPPFKTAVFCLPGALLLSTIVFFILCLFNNVSWWCIWIEPGIRV